MALSFEDLAVVLGGRAVLTDLSATLAPGRITAIVGPNGAGKSTLVKAAAALIVPTSGAVRLDGQDVGRIDPRRRARAIGYLPQDATVHWNMRVREVVALGRLPHRRPHAAPSMRDLVAIDRALADTDTAAFADRLIDTLSGGERARVMLARVLAGEPDWLLADEPLASLDPAHQFDLLDRLRAVADRGAGVAIVLHDLAHAARIADDVLVLDDGRLVATALTPEVVARIFGVAARWVADAEDRPQLMTTGRLSGSAPPAR